MAEAYLKINVKPLEFKEGSDGELRTTCPITGDTLSIKQSHFYANKWIPYWAVQREDQFLARYASKQDAVDWLQEANRRDINQIILENVTLECVEESDNESRD